MDKHLAGNIEAIKQGYRAIIAANTANMVRNRAKALGREPSGQDVEAATWAMVQLGKLCGLQVTATTSTGNVELVLSHGADVVIDYHTADLTRLTERFDVIADTVGAMDFATAQKLLRPNGRYLAIAGAMKEMLGSLRKGPEGKRMIAGPADERLEDIVELGRLAALGQFRPHIDKVYAFTDMPAAHAHADTGRKRGSVVVQVAA